MLFNKAFKKHGEKDSDESDNHDDIVKARDNIFSLKSVVVT
jgi:hypothetical protein